MRMSFQRPNVSFLSNSSVTHLVLDSSVARCLAKVSHDVFLCNVWLKRLRGVKLSQKIWVKTGKGNIWGPYLCFTWICSPGDCLTFTIETAINPPSRGDIGKAELGETTCLIPIPLVEVSGFFFLALENPDDPWISQDLDTLFAASPNDSIHSNLSTSCWKAASLCDGSRYSNPLKTVNLASEYIYIYFTTNLPVFQIYTKVQKTFTNYLVVEPLSHSFQKKCSSNCNVDLPPSFGVKINITAFETTA